LVRHSRPALSICAGSISGVHRTRDRLPLAQFLGRLALVTPQLGYQRDHPGIDAGHQPVGFLALVVATNSPMAPPGRSAMSAPRSSRIRSRLARSRSQRLERRDAGIAARDFERYGGAGFL
jgi:hypothetical protein